MLKRKVYYTCCISCLAKLIISQQFKKFNCFLQKEVKTLNHKPDWTGDACKLMHIHDIKAAEVTEVLNWSTPYFSDVINGKKTPAGAEEKVMTAINEIIVIRNVVEVN